MSKRIRIYLVTHKECFVPQSKILVPIQVGTAINGNVLPNMIHDNEDDNISIKNRMYCELTAQYWAWKNDKDSEYVGFFHYRRYLNFSGNDLHPDCWGNINYDQPLSDEILEELGIDDSNMENVINRYDIIVPKPRIIPDGKNVYDDYITAKGQHKEDLDLTLKILYQKYPEYKKSAETYLSSNKPYEVNMFIMRTDLYKQYAEWLFNILFEVEKQSDFSAYSQYELRVMGFLSERLFGIWFVHNREKLNLKTLELQKTLFRNTDKSLSKLKTKENSVVVVLACNDFYVPYLSCMVQSIIQNAKQNRPYELFVFTTDISEENQGKLKKIAAHDKRFSLQCINIKSLIGNQNFFVHLHVSVETYYRLYILLLFHDTKKVLYLDSDMVVNADIAELYDIDIGDSYLAAVKDIDIAGRSKSIKELSFYVKNIVGCIGADEYFQAGVLLLNIQAMKNKADLPELIKTATERNWNCWDQDVLNHVYQKKICYLNQTWNCLMDWREPHASRMASLKDAPFALYNEYLEARKNPKIVHYAGYQKPWNKVNCDFAEYFWKYARQTEFYEEILRRFFEATKQPDEKDKCIGDLRYRIEQLEKNICSRPYFIKLYFGKTLIFRVLRKIWLMANKIGNDYYQGLAIDFFGDATEIKNDTRKILLKNNSDVVEIAGWAFDVENFELLNSVYLKTSQKIVKALYGGSRPDITNWTGKNQLENSGFSVSITKDDIRDVEKISFILITKKLKKIVIHYKLQK